MSIDFRSFMASKPALLQAHPAAIDLTQTNLVSALAYLRPAPTADSLPARAHRCHLAEFWLDAFALPRSLKQQALVSEGVRHSLRLLFGGYAQKGCRLCLPADVYPVYLDLAAQAGGQVSTYLASAPLTQTALENTDVLLLTNPAKPWGSWLSAEETAMLTHWLERDKDRRIIIDAVYTWETLFDVQTMALFATDQAIVLHSLSKTWLWPLVCGIALIPAQDIEYWTPIFRAASPSQANLQLAHALLTQYRTFPAVLPDTLAAKEQTLRIVLAERDVPIADIGNVRIRYHFIVQRHWQQLLSRHNVLALPATVFGYPSEEVSIVTSLPANPD